MTEAATSYAATASFFVWLKKEDLGRELATKAPGGNHSGTSTPSQPPTSGAPGGNGPHTRIRNDARRWFLCPPFSWPCVCACAWGDIYFRSPRVASDSPRAGPSARSTSPTSRRPSRASPNPTMRASRDAPRPTGYCWSSAAPWVGMGRSCRRRTRRVRRASSFKPGHSARPGASAASCHAAPDPEQGPRGLPHGRDPAHHRGSGRRQV